MIGEFSFLFFPSLILFCSSEFCICFVAYVCIYLLFACFEGLNSPFNGTCRLRTTLCLQYKPHYIAAGSLYLASKFQKVKLPSEKGKVWWMQFEVSPKLLEGLLLFFPNTVPSFVSS